MNDSNVGVHRYLSTKILIVHLFSVCKNRGAVSQKKLPREARQEREEKFYRCSLRALGRKVFGFFRAVLRAAVAQM